MSSPRSAHPAPTYSSSKRQHPYAERPRGTQSAPRRRSVDDRMPPSPRSGHDSSKSPSPKPIDPNDNYWDDVPAPPASLKSILDSFRASGEGDRDLLMAILGAKKAEEERLTAIIQTRLTVLQARLNLAAVQAQLNAPMPPSPTDYVHHERTPSLSHSTASSAINSPPIPHAMPQYFNYNPAPSADRKLPPMNFENRLPPLQTRDRDSPRRPEGLEMLLEGVREAERKERA